MAALKVDAALSSTNYGRELAYRGDYAGVSRLARRVMTRANVHDYEALGGYFLAVADMCAAAHAKGARFSVDPPTREAVAHALRTDVGDFFEAGALLQSALLGARQAGIRWRLVADEAPPAPAPQSPQKPQEIRILSMPSLHVASTPARETRTTIERGLDGEMTGSRATETDKA